VKSFRVPSSDSRHEGPILLTGATGYIGGRLLSRLQADSHQVRCLARWPEFLESKLNASTEAVRGDLLRPETLADAFCGITTAYYLVHSMASAGDFAAEDRMAAESFGRAARRAGVQRIIYLGGLGSDESLSSHLASRQEVGKILRKSGVPTVEFRASIIIGSGSLSFEMIRSLVDKLPVMVTPRWVRTFSQPIAVEDVIEYLVLALDVPASGNVVFEIGGAEEASYGDIMKEYARQRGLRRVMIPVPVLSPRISALWLRLITPLYARVGRKLIDSLRNTTVVRDRRAMDAFPIRPRGFADAIRRALENEDHEFAQTRWSDALSSVSLGEERVGVRYGRRMIDSRVLEVSADPEIAFRPIRRIGGDQGWYAWNWLWRLRGTLDLLIGGPGLRRGRRDSERIVPGDTLDFWRVESFVPGRMLRLVAEMRLPGRAWLQFEVQPSQSGSTIRQTAEFDPRGLTGMLYWYGLYPLHGLVFRGMLHRIATLAGEVHAQGRKQ
jgi:uncharacterized protein YbjT (DUF2867 family)